MAKKHLDAILDKIRAEIDSTDKLRDDLNKNTHEYKMSVSQVYTEFSKQLSSLIETLDSPSEKEIARRKLQLKVIAKDYVAHMYNGLKSAAVRKGAVASIEFTNRSHEENFKVLISNPEGATINIFGKIAGIRSRNPGGLPYVRDKILATVFSNAANDDLATALYGKKSEKTGEREGGLTQLGHDKAGSVSIRRKEQLLRRFQFSKSVTPLIESTSTTRAEKAKISLAIRTYARAEVAKLKEFSLTIKVSEENTFKNQADAGKERSFLRALGREVSETLKQLDFFKQRGSADPIEIVTSRLMAAGIKAGGNGRAPAQVRDEDNKSSIKIMGKTTRSSSSEKIKATVPKAPTEAKSAQRNWLQLLPLINTRLPEKVRQNMGEPRLRNRTGRLAQSARVVNVEQTRGGTPSFVFDYAREPYDVFDPVLGASPWNTPQRNPRTLVDVSVREIVREMAIGRFFTRRA